MTRQKSSARRGRGFWDTIKGGISKAFDYKQQVKDFIKDNKLVSTGLSVAGHPHLGMAAGMLGYGKHRRGGFFGMDGGCTGRRPRNNCNNYNNWDNNNWITTHPGVPNLDGSGIRRRGRGYIDQSNLGVNPSRKCRPYLNNNI